jgi:hypothetical protein
MHLDLTPRDALVLHLFEMGAYNKQRAPRWPTIEKSRMWKQDDNYLWLTSAGLIYGAELRSLMEDVMMELRVDE